MKKVCVVITARPSYSRIRDALYALKKYENIELQLVVAASANLNTYGKVVKQIEKDGFDTILFLVTLEEGTEIIISHLSDECSLHAKDCCTADSVGS